jgi:23S rRNA-/tRNA-specific pseudouridylate synthase
MLAVEPQTGRTHQIRVHAAHAGTPLVGDGAYGGPTRIVAPTGAATTTTRIALHCARVEVPGARGPLVAEAEIPPDLRAIWAKLGGDDAAWAAALAKW